MSHVRNQSSGVPGQSSKATSLVKNDTYVRSPATLRLALFYSGHIRLVIVRIAVIAVGPGLLLSVSHFLPCQYTGLAKGFVLAFHVAFLRSICSDISPISHATQGPLIFSKQKLQTVQKAREKLNDFIEKSCEW